VRVAEQSAGIQFPAAPVSAWPNRDGLTETQTYSRSSCQAFRIILPALTSEFMNASKKLLGGPAIGLLELTGARARRCRVQLQRFESVTAGER